MQIGEWFLIRTIISAAMSEVFVEHEEIYRALEKARNLIDREILEDAYKLN